MLEKHIVIDKYGYPQEVEARTPEEAIRKASNLSAEADLRYSTVTYWGLSSSVTDEEWEEQVRIGRARNR